MSTSVRSEVRSDRALYLRSFREARPYWPHIGAYFLTSLLATPLALLAPIPLKLVADSVVGNQPLPGALEWLMPTSFERSATAILAFAAGLVVAVVVLRQLQSLAVLLLRTYASERMLLGFRARIFRHVQRLSIAYHDSSGTADSTYRIVSDAGALSSIAIEGLVPLVTSITTTVSMLVVIAALDWTLGVVALLVTPLFLVLSERYRKRLRPRYREVKELESSALGVIQEVLTSLRVVKAFGQEDREQARFLDRSSRGVRARLGLAVSEATFSMLTKGCVALGTGAVLYLGTTHVLDGTLTFGELLLAMGYVGQLFEPISSIARRVTSVQSSLAGVERAFELLDRSPDVAESSGAIPLARAAGDIRLDHVSFSYGRGVLALDDVSIDVPAGSRVGILGPTGAGKTTLVSLLSRFYDPTTGAIALDGRDLRDYRLADLRQQYGVVLQEPVLFSTTIAENIAYAKEGASLEEVIEAAKLASAHEFIVALPEGYETKVGERGMRLSGGERQRISLARAFLKDAPMLILDEPTSSVDVATESLIMDAIERLMLSRTTFVIAHRLSTLKNCDIWLRLDHGRVVEVTTQRPADVREAVEALAEAESWVGANA